MASGENRKPSRSGYARVTINVRLGADPEFHAINSERGLVTFRGAMNHVDKNEDGEFVEIPSWFSFKMWCNVDQDGAPYGPAGVVLNRYKTGNWITVNGRLEITPWSRNGKSGVENRVTVDEVSYDNMPAPTNDEEEGEEEDAPVRAPARGGRQAATAGSRRRSSSEDANYKWE